MAKTMKAGVVGAGGISGYHIGGLRAAGVEVAAIADPELARARARAGEYAVGGVFESYREMLAKCPELDLVTVGVPNKYHAEVARAALEAGKHVFCEKPPALNAAETLEMKEAAERRGLVLMFDFNNRARPEAQALLDYIRRGEVGRINSAQATWVRRCGIPGFGGWFTQKALSGGGPVIDLLHMIDLALYFMGFPEPEWVLAQTFDDFINDKAFKGPWGIPDVAGSRSDVESAAHSFIRFKSGQVLFCRNSWAEMVGREEVSVTFQGSRAGGMIRRLFKRDGLDDELNASDDCELYGMENGLRVNRRIVVDPDPKMGRERAVVNFVNTILGSEEPYSKPAEAVILMRVIEAIYRSAAAGEPVRIA
ncbi:MAG TPA: Gfo/Idh/MocA family oxidoreductase [bacterium]|nr:Gfo/Idh/MocA family oxidoreductase [bacterium]HNS49340.1 Gfo/Idh/MocA family oxidoreductase [bacterium]